MQTAARISSARPPRAGPPPWARWGVYLALAALSIKSLQDVAGVRLVSLLVPFLIFFAFSYRRGELSVPPAVRYYALYGCLGLPLISVVSSGKLTFYEAYLACTIICGLLLIIVAVRKLKISPLQLAQAYADAMTVMCVLSVFTLERQWFGGYTLRTFSDFATFFGLQVSVAVPFIGGKYKNAKRLICVVALFFMFSRLSFILSVLMVMVQLARESRPKFIRGVALGTLVLSALAVTSDIGTLMLDKMANLAATIMSPSTATVDINASDLGRLAYATVTLDALSSVKSLAFGHGIKTNHLIIAEQLDTSVWGLDEEMADGTVHNVYIELLSDVGIAGLLGFLAFVVYAGFKLVRKFGVLSAYCLSFLTFSLSYMFEANYVTFFFQFFVCFYLWIASTDSDSQGYLGQRPMRHPS